MNQNNFAIKSGNANIEAKNYDRKTKRGLYLPTVSLSANYIKLDEDVQVDISSSKDMAVGMANIPQAQMLPDQLLLLKEQFGLASVNMKWPIFTGGKIRAANKLMDAKIDEATYQLDETKNKLNTELVERYYGYRLVSKAVKLKKEAYDAMLLHQTHASKMEENGMISKAQRLYIDLSVSNAKTEWQQALQQKNIVESALKNTLGDSTNVIAISELFLNTNLKELNYFVNQTKENNPLLKQVESKASMAKQNYNIQRANYLPNVSVIGNKRLYTKNLSDLSPDWFAGVNMSWTIFDGTARYNQMQSARSTVDMVNYIEQKAEADLLMYVNKLYNELQMQIEQLQTMESTYEFASEYLRVQKKAFSEGFATSKEVVDAELNVNKVKIGRINVMKDYVCTLAKLLEVSGQTNTFLTYAQQDNSVGEDFNN
jgi:outer membrane protein TolC